MNSPTFNPAAEFNTITSANTFQDWVTTTNSLVQQNNDIAANNFYKNTGTLFLNEPTTALQTNSTVVLGGSTYLTRAVVGTLQTTDIVLTGNTQYQSNTFVINSGSFYNSSAGYNVYRPGNLDASIFWNEPIKKWQIRDVNNSYLPTALSTILTANLISSSLTSTSQETLATSSTVNTLFTMVTSTSAGASNTFIGTTGTANPVSGVVTLKSNNNISINGVGNTIYFNTQQDISNTASPRFASLSLNSALAVTQGGTGANNFLGALNNLLPSVGQISGYVLSCTGTGQYYWGLGGGGGGAGGGNTITTHRVYYSADAGQQVFTGAPSYTVGSGQLRIYIDGNRQFGSEYSESSNTSFTLNTPAAAGDLILAEVDAYTTAFFANNTPYTANTQWLTTAQNTIQTGIDGALGLAGAAYSLANTDNNFANAAFAQANSAISAIGNLSSTITTSSLTATTGNITTFGATTANVTSANVATANITFANITTANITTANITTLITSATISGSTQISSLGVGTTASANTGEIRATNNITAYYSDERLKTKLGNIENALDKVKSLTGFYYEANETAQALGYKPRREVGVSAQDVEKVLPEIVTPAPIDEQYLTIYYDRLTPLLIEAIKELSSQVEEIKQKLNSN